MENKLKYTTTEQQIAKLKSQNLIIEDEVLAKTKLECFGYSNLIKSYRAPYIIKSSSGISYRSGVTFEQIASLYLLDKNLRNAVMAAMQDLEEHIKEVTASVVSQNFGVDPDIYLQYKNYANKRKTKKQFFLSSILDDIKKKLSTDKDPIHHYQTTYGLVPPWILFKSVYFSTIVNYIDQLKVKEQEDMVGYLYDTNVLKLPTDSLRKLMMDTLFICIDYRNIAAHGGRIYTFESSGRFRSTEIFGHNISTSGFSTLLFLLSLFKYQNPYKRLKSALDHEVNRHCEHYSNDVTYLAKVLNLNIKLHKIVWVSAKSKKYHSKPHCSGIQNARQMDLEIAEKEGYIPCKRCIGIIEN